MEIILGLFGLLFSISFVVVPILLLSGIRIVDQYQRGLVLTFGKFTGIRQPGFRFIVPIVQRMIKIDMRIATVDVPRQEVITLDNVTISVDAVVYFRVADPEKAILEVQNFRTATVLYAQAAMRDAVGSVELDTLLSERDRISKDIKENVDKESDKWGIDVDTIKIQNVELPQDMKRVISKQAEAEREKRAVITKAEGEVTASENLMLAAKKLGEVPGALHLRTLNTLNDLSSDQSNTVVFAVPLEILRAFETVADSGISKKLIQKVVKKG